MSTELQDAIIIEYFNYGMSDYAKLILPPGKLCILKGENNNGKSCLFYGLEWLLLNDPLAKSLINNKSLEQDKHAELKVRITKNDFFIEIKRSMNAISYNINGEIHDKKLNKQNIYDIQEDLQVPGFTYVKNCVYQLFNMHGEDRGLFPISENNDQAIYTLFESLLGLINSKKILSAAYKDVNECTTQYQMFDAENKRLENKVNTLNTSLASIDENKIQETIIQIEYLEPEIAKLIQNKNALTKFAKIKDVKIPEKIDYENLAKIVPIYQQYLRVKHNLTKSSNQLKRFYELNESKSLLLNKIDYSNLDLCKKILEKLVQTKTSIIAQLQVITDLQAQKSETENQKSNLESLWKDVKVCPMCGHAMH